MPLEKTKKTYSSYCDALGGDIELGLLISSVQAETIKMGTLLERLIFNYTQKKYYVQRGKKVKISQGKNVTPDLTYIRDNTIHYYEIKYGSVFDTKKSFGEIETLNSLYNLHKTHQKDVLFQSTKDVICGFVSWNAKSENEIMRGIKLKTLPENIKLITGKEFAKLFEFDYNMIVDKIHTTTDINKKIFLNTIHDYMITHNFEPDKKYIIQ